METAVQQGAGARNGRERARHHDGKGGGTQVHKPGHRSPCSLSVSVADMGPNGLGDAQVNDDDIVLLFNGHDHYNGLVSASIAGLRSKPNGKIAPHRKLTSK